MKVPENVDTCFMHFSVHPSFTPHRMTFITHRRDLFCFFTLSSAPIGRVFFPLNGDSEGQVSKLDQLVFIEHEEINSHKTSSSTQQAPLIGTGNFEEDNRWMICCSHIRLYYTLPPKNCCVLRIAKIK
jgi:hypothetical protein